MAGWLLVWSRDGTPIDERRWAAARARAAGEGAVVSEAEAPLVGASDGREPAPARARLIAWRRSAGEFPSSGTLRRVGDTHVAWLGQALDDAAADGDGSERAAALLAVEALEERSAAAINGPFAAAAIGPRGVRVVVDRYRHYPVHLHAGTRWCAAATDVASLAPWIERREIDPEAVDALVRVGELFDRRTLLRGVDLLPPGTILEDHGAGPRERRSFALRHTGDARGSMEDLAAEAGERLRNSVARIERACPRLAITLSGGLDSRLILGLCARRASIPSFTWGLPGCRDIACAAAFARRVGSPHTVRHWDPPAFPPLWPRGVELTGGMFGVESMHMLPFTGLLARHGDVVLNGLAGDVILGGNFLKLSWLRERDVRALAASAWRWRVSPGQDAWADRLAPRSRGAARQAWVESIAGEEGASPVARLNDWLYPNRIFRYTNWGTQLLRERVESHAPFWDNDFIDFVLRVPLRMRLKHRFYLRAMARVCPDAAATPWQRTGIPPAWGFWANTASMAAQRVIGAAATRLGRRAFASNMVADPAGWLRGPWRAVAEEALLGARARERGLVDHGVLRAMWDEHQAGGNHTRTLGTLIAIEHAARLWVDGDVVPEAGPDEARAAREVAAT